jgi:hypothetical protein
LPALSVAMPARFRKRAAAPAPSAEPVSSFAWSAFKSPAKSDSVGAARRLAAPGGSISASPATAIPTHTNRFMVSPIWARSSSMDVFLESIPRAAVPCPGARTDWLRFLNFDATYSSGEQIRRECGAQSLTVKLASLPSKFCNVLICQKKRQTGSSLRSLPSKFHKSLILCAKSDLDFCIRSVFAIFCTHLITLGLSEVSLRTLPGNTLPFRRAS